MFCFLFALFLAALIFLVIVGLEKTDNPHPILVWAMAIICGLVVSLSLNMLWHLELAML